MTEQVPVVELSASLDQYLSGKLSPESQEGLAAAQVVKMIGDSLRRWGFVSISGHGIKPELLDEAYAAARKTFALSDQIKSRYEDVEGGRQRGYTPLLMERAKGQSLGDLKEFWHIGRELSDNHPYRMNGSMRPNLFPEETPRFKSAMSRLYTTMDELAHRMLRVIELYLKIDAGRLSALADEGNSVLRVLHYPALDAFEERAEGSVRAAAHEDINLLTLLPAATEPGLQLLTHEGDWLDITPPAGAIILDTGDMMSAVTCGALPATTHRVINPAGTDASARLSMPFFMHPRPDAHLDALVKSKGERNGGSVEGLGLTAAEFLSRRLEENGLA